VKNWRISRERNFKKWQTEACFVEDTNSILNISETKGSVNLKVVKRTIQIKAKAHKKLEKI
jgi:hypothetical protein